MLSWSRENGLDVFWEIPAASMACLAPALAELT